MATHMAILMLRHQLAVAESVVVPLELHQLQGLSNVVCMYHSIIVLTVMDDDLISAGG